MESIFSKDYKVNGSILVSSLVDRGVNLEYARALTSFLVKHNAKTAGINMNNVLLVTGSTGTGKTIAINLLQDLVEAKIVFSHVNGATIVKSGIVGQGIDDILTELYQKTKNVEDTDIIEGVIVIDEFDKVNIDVMKELLLLMEKKLIAFNKNYGQHSERIEKRVCFSFILMGSFQSLRNKHTDFKDIFAKKDILPREVVGRIDSHIELNSIDKDQLTKILLHSPKSPLLEMTQLFDFYGLELEFKKESIDLFTDYVKISPFGIREVSKIINDILTEHISEIDKLTERITI